MELNFRVILVPQQQVDSNEKEALLSRVKTTVGCCGCVAVCVSVNYSQIKKSEEEEHPEIEELVLDVKAKSKFIGKKSQLYEDFCSEWKNHCNSMLQSYMPCSYIELYGNDSFVKSKRNHHHLACQAIAFGVLPHNGKFNQYASLQPQLDNFVHFYHDTRNIIMEYSSFELHISYDNIRNIFVNIDREPCKIYLDLFNPPIVFRRDNKYQMKYRNLNLSQNDKTSNRYSRTWPEVIPSGAIDVDVLGRTNVLSLSFADSNKVREIIARIHFHCSEKSVYFSCIIPYPQNKPTDPTIIDIHFGCTYLITAIIKRNFVFVSQANEQLDINLNLKRLYSLCQENADCLEKALTTVLVALDSGKILNFWHAIEEQYSFYTTNKSEINFKEYIVPSKCCMIRRITLTPTRQLLWPAEIMYSNRVLRNYDSEYSVRVSFREDNMSKVSFNAFRADQGVLYACIKKPMTDGLYIGYRIYEFLAWSNSQIRDHGVWMYARDGQGTTAAHIRAWMGNFSHIHNVPKYMARMGQCFSQTEDALSVPLDPLLVRTVNDIEGEMDPVNSKPYCFSDGIGRISTELAAKVHDALGHDKLCSAFQIRYGGFKGVLTIDPTLENAQIEFRNSMKKFDCPNSTRLEIAMTSSPIALKLNRPFITLLNDLGVRHRTFLRLQEEMLTTLTDMLFKEDEAAKFLTSKTPTSLFKYKEISDSGIHLTTEPFFKSLLLALHRHHIENIKLRANIDIDPSKGRNMLGVLDETGYLNYGQVFVQYSKDISYGETTRDTLILTGEVLVTKNPCMYPGDVRKFTAVDVPQLHHIVDCIVFPQRGPRPHPNEMGGSDLDGDEYSVLWAPELIFHRPNESPAHFPSFNAPGIPFIDVRDMIDFLQQYIKNDQVGMIATAHLAHADIQGIFSGVCESIAKKFSIAVDFAKNGESRQLEKEERPKEYPDFMEKTFRDVKKSTKALGKMYRVCKDFETENESTSITYGTISVDPDLVYNGWDTYKSNAVSARNKYNALFRSVLRNYGIQHEAEAFSGAFTNLHCRFQERKDRDEIQKVILGCIKKLTKCMFEEFMEEFKNSGDVDENVNKMLQKASAWYVVTYSDPSAKFLSFPWTVSQFLINIKLRRTLSNPLPFSPAIMDLDKKMLECETKGLLPTYVETRIWNDYLIECDSKILSLALRTLIFWAQEEGIIERPGQTTGGLLYLDVFIKLFFFVSEKFGYVTRRHKRVARMGNLVYSAADLCLEFFKFCSTFRFYTKEEMKDVLPFNLYKYSKLGKLAIVSYHKFALSGTLQTLNFDKQDHQELVVMKPPIYIDSKIFGMSPITETSLRSAENALMKYSKIQYVSLREILQSKKVCVSADGTDQAIRDLKGILRKKHVFLRQLFQTGIMPEKTI